MGYHWEMKNQPDALNESHQRRKGEQQKKRKGRREIAERKSLKIHNAFQADLVISCGEIQLHSLTRFGQRPKNGVGRYEMSSSSSFRRDMIPSSIMIGL